MKAAKQKTSLASQSASPTPNNKIRQRTSAGAEMAESKRRVHMGEKALKQELKRRTLEFRQTSQELKRALYECRRIEKSREQQSLLLAALIANAGGPVFSVDRRYCYTSFNKQHAEVMKSLFGADIEIGHNLLDYHTSPADRLSARKNIDRAFKGETVIVESYAGDEKRFRRYFEIVHSPIRATNNKVVGVTVHARDITERRQTDAEIESLEKFPSENPNPVLRVSFEGVLLYANAASQPLLEEWQACVGQLLPEFWQVIISEAQGEKKLVEVNCSEQVFSFMVSPVPGMGYINLYGRNITQHVKAEQALQESERRLRQAQELLEAITKETNVIIAAVDNNYCYTFFNQAYQDEVRRLSSRDIHVGTSMLETFAHMPEQQKVILAEWGQVLAGESTNKTLEFGDSGHYQRFYNVLHTPIRGVEGNVVGAGEVAYDVTEQLRIQEIVQRNASDLRGILDATKESIWMFDADGVILMANETALSRLRKTSKEAIGKNFREFISAEVAQTRQTCLRQVVETGRPVELEDERVGIAFHHTFYPVKDADGRVTRIVSFSRDITASKLAEEALRESEERFKVITSSTPDHILVQDRELRYTFVINPQLGLTKKDMLGKTDFDFLKKEDAETLTRIKRKVLETGRAVHIQQPLISPNGTKQIFDGSYIPKRSADGKIDGLIGYFKNVTGIKRIEELLRASEERYRNLFNTMDEGFCIIQMIFDAQDRPVDYRFLEVNAAFEKQTGLPDVQGKLMRELAPAHESHWFEIYGKIALTGEPAHFTNEARELGHWYEVYAYRVGTPEERRVAIIFNDITERRKADAETQRLLIAVREEKDRLAALVNNITDEVWFADTNKKFTLVNPAGLREFGVDPNNAMDVEKMVASMEVYRPDGSPRPIDETPPLCALRGEIVKNMEEIVRFPASGQLRYREINAAPVRGPDGVIIGAVSVARDITERKLAEENICRLNRTLRALSNTNQALIHATDEKEYLDSVCKIIVEDCGHAMVWIGFKEQDKAKSVRPVASAGFEEGYLETLKITWADSERGRGPTGTAIRTGKPARCLNMLTDPQFAPWRTQALKRSYASSLVLPLLDGEQVLGAITIYSPKPDAFSEEEEKLLTELAGDLAYGLRAIRIKIAHALGEDALRQSEQRYRSLFNSMTEGFALHEIIYGDDGRPCDFRFLDINPAFERLTGLKREDVVGKTHNEVLLGDSPKWVEAYGKVALTGEPVTFDNYSPALQKHYEVFAYRPAAGQFAVIFIDITARKRMEQSLRETEQRFRLALRNAPVTVAIQDRDLVFQWAYNQRTLDPTAIIGKKDTDIFPAETAARLVTLKHKALETETEVHEQTWVTSGDQRLFLDLFIEPLWDATGRVTGLGIATVDLTPMKLAEQDLTEARDKLEERIWERTQELVAANEQLQNEIAERERAETALQESERRYRTLFETSPDAVILIDLEDKVLFANHQAAEMYGYQQAAELVGINTAALIAPEDREFVLQSIIKTLELGSLREIEYQILKKDGIRFPAELNVTAVREEKGNPIGFLLDIRDITERKWAEELLRMANAYNRSLIETSLDPLVTITPEGKIGDVNQATEKVTGFTRAELIGTDFHTYFSDPVKARLGYQKVFETGTVRDYDLEICHKDGSTTPVLYNASLYRDETGKVLGVFAVARDITDRKQFETQLVQAEKHAVIGRMVGSITHEINNPLQTIKNCLYLIQQDVTADNPIQEPLEMARSETLRITNLVGHLRELYRPKTGLLRSPHEILDILEEAHSLLIPHLNNARVQWQPLTGLQRCYVNCVRDQILEVFLNISMNAIEAMQSHGGTLFVNMGVSEDSAAIIFKDTGPGIPDEMAPHLFEPFMTTKASGLGLGLSITYGIVQRHGGQIQVDNQPGQGASFTVLLPLITHGGGKEESQHGNK